MIDKEIALYAKKIGMTQIFDDNGNVIPVTVLEMKANSIIGKRSKDKDGYDATILAAFEKKEKYVKKPVRGQFPKEMAPCSKIFEEKGFKDKKVGDMVGVEQFEMVPFVDVSGTSKGKGFQGVMRRHGAHGGPAKHGSKFHRHIGSSGQSANPSRIRKGTKGAGRMGNKTVTLLNLRVVQVDKEQNRLLIKGCIPGSIHSAVRVRPSVKKNIIVVAGQEKDAV